MDTYGCSAHVLVNGRKVKEYRHNGLTFVEAKDGTEFSIEIKNHSQARVLAIVSVDGLDVIKGQTATAKSPGFIINAYSSEIVKGWQKSDTDAAAFKFTHKENSYASDKGVGENNGVIAVKFIAEKLQQYPPTPTIIIQSCVEGIAGQPTCPRIWRPTAFSGCSLGAQL